MAHLSLELLPVCLEHLQHLGLHLVHLKPRIPVRLEAHPRHPRRSAPPPLAADLVPSQILTSSLFSQRTLKLANPAGDNTLLQCKWPDCRGGWWCRMTCISPPENSLHSMVSGCCQTTHIASVATHTAFKLAKLTYTAMTDCKIHP